MLDLVAEVARGDVEQRAAVDVRRADQLAHVPGALRLVLHLLLGEGVLYEDGTKDELAVTLHIGRLERGKVVGTGNHPPEQNGVSRLADARVAAALARDLRS